MREVFGERGLNTSNAARAIKPTEVGDAAKRQNSDTMPVNKGGFTFDGYPRRGDRCGDMLHSKFWSSLKTDFLVK